MAINFLKIVTAMGKISEGVGLLERALHLDPSNKAVQQDLMRLQTKQKLEVQKERSLYKKMFQLDDSASVSSSNTNKEKRKIKLPVSASSYKLTIKHSLPFKLRIYDSWHL